MAPTTGFVDLVAYKLRYVGVFDTLRLAYLNVAEAILLRIGRAFPSVFISPRSIQIEATTRCNLKCTFCELSYWTEVAADLNVADFQKMLEHLPRLRRLELTGIGEPLMNREIYKILGYAKSRGIRISMTDNFTMVTEKAARRLVDLGVDRICLSLDGATKASYEKVRVGANFDKVTRNARRLIEIRRQAGRRKPEVMANFVVTADSYPEATAVVELAHDLGIRLVQFDCVKTFDKTEAFGTDAVADAREASLEAAFARARALGVLVKWMYFEQDVAIEHCSRPWNRNFVTRDGYVHPCCLTTQTGDRQAQNRRSLGNLIDDPIERLWKSDEFSGLRKKMREGILPHACHMCPSYTGKPDVEGKAREMAQLSAAAGTPVKFVSRGVATEKTPTSQEG